MAQICKYKNTNGLQDILTPSTSVPKQIESESEIGTQSVISFTEQMGSMKRCCGVNPKHVSAESGIWNLAQTPQKNLKSLEAKPSEISNFSVVFESQIPNSTLCRNVFGINTTTSFH